MNIHFILRSPVYTSLIKEWIQAIGSQNHTFVIVSSYKQIEVIGNESSFKGSFFKVKRFLKKLTIEKIFYHYLSPQMAILSHDLNCKKRVWILWGADLYDHPKIRKKYLHPSSARFKKPKWLTDYIKNKYVAKVMATMTHLACNSSDYEEAKNSGLIIQSKHITLNALFPLEQYILDIPLTSNEVLIGNSDDVFNNHFAVIDWLEELPSKLNHILPLSGVKNNYTIALENKVNESKLSIELLDTFLDRSEFFKRLQKVRCILFGHYRQQGLGTLIPLLANGRKLILSKKNPIYKLFKSWGLHLTALENATITDLLNDLSEDQKAQNKKALESALDKSLILSQWNKILSD